MRHGLRWNYLCLLALGALLAARPSGAQMIPLHDEGHTEVWPQYQGVDGPMKNHYPPVPFAFWEMTDTSTAATWEPCQDPPTEQCIVGQCDALAYVITQFFPAGFQFSGSTSASWGVPPSGYWLVSSSAGYQFRLTQAVDYDLFMDVDQGDALSIDGQPGGQVWLAQMDTTGVYTDLVNHYAGPTEIQGRIGPGVYKLAGWSIKTGGSGSYTGTTYSAQFTVSQPPEPFIITQPFDRSAGCGGTVTFAVGTKRQPSNYTFQWRKNGVALTNGPGVSGATTPNLTLTNVCAAANYDVVVTGPNPIGGTVAEPSRLAHLFIVTPTGVAVEPAGSTAPAIRAAAPNPFRSSTSVDYVVHQPTRLTATVFNAAGARIRTLADRIVTGPGSVSWDGRLSSGDRAPTGIYFIRFELGTLRETRKAVLLQ